MPKQQPITTAEAEELLGGGSLLDRIGRGPTSAEKQREDVEANTLSMEDTTQTVKVSLYLSPAEINALDTQIIKRRGVSGHSPRRTHLIREAIRLWLLQQN